RPCERRPRPHGGSGEVRIHYGALRGELRSYAARDRDILRSVKRTGKEMFGELIGSVRRNHALEHATITVLLNKLGRDVRMVGRATRDGYYLYADVPTDLLEESTFEALRRLKSGEGHLAVSPLCGTNLAVAGALAGIASTLP